MQTSRSTKKIDWHNYKQIELESKQTGPGDQGAPHYLSPEDEKIKDSLYKVNGFNALVSDRIALNRTLKDIRHPEYEQKFVERIFEFIYLSDYLQMQEKVVL